MLAKNIGDNSMYDNVSNLEFKYLLLFESDITRPAIKAPVISATPKNSSAQKDNNKQNTKAIITNLLKSL